MSHGIFLWNSHPINLAVGVAWLQVGIGLILLVSNGMTGRIAGLVSALWAALVWLIVTARAAFSSPGIVPLRLAGCHGVLRDCGRVAVLEARDLSSVVLARRAARHRRDRGLRGAVATVAIDGVLARRQYHALTAMTS